MASSANFVTLFAGLSSLQLHLYKTILRRDLEIINNETAVTNATLLGTVMQLKQCCSHPYLFDGMEKEQVAKERSESLQPDSSTIHHLIKHCGKLLITDGLITKILNKNKNKHMKILLCSHIKEMFEWFEAYCNQRGISYKTISDRNAQTSLDTINKHCDVLIHHTSNTNVFHRILTPLLSNVDTIIFYDTDWMVKDNENEIIATLEATQKVSIYRICTKDTLEEKLCSMQQKKELNTKELKTLIRYKANTILNISSSSTLNVAQEPQHNITQDVDQEEEEVEIPTKYTLKDIINHPENQGVIRVFSVFFIAMIIIPVIIVICLNKYVMQYVLLNWTDSGKQNVTIVIGVAIAHVIGLIYVCYAWSGEDRTPARILDDDQVAEKKHDALVDDQGVKRSLDKTGINTLRKRKIN